jgi:hypothetical protein
LGRPVLVLPLKEAAAGRRGHPLFGQKVQVSQVHIAYDAKGLSSKLQDDLLKMAPRYGVELHFDVP